MKDIPGDYYRRLAEIDDRHWWVRGMIEIESALIAPWLEREPGPLLDAGCGTGGFLAWAGCRGAFTSLSGVDLSPEAIDIAHGRVPMADLRVAPLSSLPFDGGAFDVVALNDVLQHVDESEARASMVELRRVLASDGVLVVRTNGARRGRRERSDWRLYEPASLRAELERGGFDVRRLTFANMIFSALSELRGGRPRAPSGRASGVPASPGAVASKLGALALSLEARVIERGGRVPWGHTLLALAVPR